ncbi:F0F1 ATP synthase subunit A [Desulfolucanica intricata]|uniref:F0F1 ATP synthase subunit A n=1 Tax=Desulfolucanica intricata TaxID=1285191 RepID=UPI00082C6148|nr:F0F1 ATP synthase subunit A [Desulfolucanica intricata]
MSEASGGFDLHHVEQELDVWGLLGKTWDLGGSLGPIPLELNVKTLLMTWITMLLVILFLMAATRNLSLRKPGKLQVVVELLHDFLKGLAFDNIGARKAAPLMALILTLFIYLLFSNLWGLVPTMSSSTADLNTTIGMALIVFLLLWYQGFKYKGGGHLKHFIKPFPVFLPINLVEEVARPVTLAFRLYGNIYAGEVLIAVLLGLLGFGSFLPSVIWLAFSIFVGFIQAFIFTMLTIAYVSSVVAEHH